MPMAVHSPAPPPTSGTYRPLTPTDVLSPTPALALGGDWAPAGLQPTHLKVYLQLTAQFFGPGTGVDIEYR